MVTENEEMQDPNNNNNNKRSNSTELEDHAAMDPPPANKRLKTEEDKPAAAEDDFTPIPVETAAAAPQAPPPLNETTTERPAAAADHEPLPMDATAASTEPIPLSTATAATTAMTTPPPPGPPATAASMDTGRDITIKQEQFPVPLLDIEHFTNLPNDMIKKPGAKRYLDEPHPSLKSPVSPFKEGKGSFSTGWWLAFHHYNRNLPEYANIRKDIICCNLCGAQVKRGERARATSALVQHLKTKIHRTVFDQLTVLWEGKARDPLVTRATGSSSSKPGPRKSLPKDLAAYNANPMAHRVRKSDFKAQKQQMRAITRWIADTNQSMDIVEKVSFRQLVHVLQETARFETKASAKDVSEEIVALNKEVREKNRAAMQGQIVWTTQGYSGTAESSPYQYLTAHFVTSSFEMACLMLEAKEQVADPKAHSMASEYLEDTTAWGMKAGLAYVLGDDDNVDVSNPGFVSSTESARSSTLGAQIEKNKGLLHVNFMDQKLSSTAEVAFDFKFAEDDSTVPETRQVLAKARELVAVFKQSSQRLADLKRMQEDLPGEYKGQDPVGVVENTDDFWWTIHDMIERLLKLRPAMEKLWQEDRELDGTKMLDTTEWDILKQILIVLKPLVLGVKALENEKVTAPLALVALNMVRGELANIQAICEGGEDNGDHEALLFAPTISKCTKELLEHFDRTWGSLEEPFQGIKQRAGSRNRQKGLHWSILMAYALDPRFKSLPHISSEKNKEAIWEAVLKEMAQVKKQTMKTDDAEETLRANQESEEAKDGEMPQDNAMMMYMMNQASPMGGRKSSCKGSTDEIDQSVKESCENEIAAYKDAESPPLYNTSAGVATNPLDWWKENHTRFPTLWSLARVFLAIPVSAASLEKKFGKPGLKTDAGGPAMEMAKERMNIRCNGLDPEPQDSSHTSGPLSV